MGILVDTHALLWFSSGDPHFPAYDVEVIW